jgi:LPXTG-motif cell wall-anchored protein
MNVPVPTPLPATSWGIPLLPPPAPGETPADTVPVVSTPVEAPSTAAAPSAPVAQTAQTAAAQLPHTGADELAALAALAMALMGSGIALAGMARRRTA